MDRDALREQIRRILADIVDKDVPELTDRTAASDVEWWDSIVHLRLLLALENELAFHFAVEEIRAPSDVGELIDLVNSKF